MTGTNLFDHIRNMLPTTVPSMLIALTIYLVAGFTLIDTSQVSFERIDAITAALDSAFWISPLIGIFYAMTGLFSPKASDQEIAEWEDNGEPVAQVTA